MHHSANWPYLRYLSISHRPKRGPIGYPIPSYTTVMYFHTNQQDWRSSTVSTVFFDLVNPLDVHQFSWSLSTESLWFFRMIWIMAPSYYLGDIVCLCEDWHGTVLSGFIPLSLWFNKHSLHLFVFFSNSTNKSSEVDFWWNVPWFQFIFPPLFRILPLSHGVMVCCRRVMSWCQAAIFPSKGRRNSWADSFSLTARLGMLTSKLRPSSQRSE